MREHRSEWADSGIDAYAAAAVKAAPCALPVSRTGCVGGQVILPLAHTIENEEASVCCPFFSLGKTSFRGPLSFSYMVYSIIYIAWTVHGGC